MNSRDGRSSDGLFRTRPRRHPVWSAKTIALVSLLDVGLVTLLVFLISKRPLFAETELSLLVIAATLLLFLWGGLYRGIRVRREVLSLPDPPKLQMGGGDKRKEMTSRSDWLELADPSLLDFLSVDEGCVGILIGAVASIVVMILLALLSILLLNVLWGGFAVLLLAMFWVFNRALRVVFVRSRQCHGKVLESLKWATLYTVAYTGWLFALVWLIHRFVGRFHAA